jgi:type II restriction enzyme
MLVVEDGIDVEILEFVKTKEGVKNLLNKTNMISLLSNGSIKNLVDYCYGIEVGMDTNARKNRGGSKIESYIESELQKIFKDRKEITINTQSIVLKNGEIELLDNKRFDLVIKNINTNKIILIEIS